MRKRVKCKNCNKIIESKHIDDLVTCDCGEVQALAGEKIFRASFSNLENFVIVDDDGNEIIPKFQKDTQPTKETITETHAKPCRNEMLDILDEMTARIKSLPDHALFSPVTHSDFGSLLMLLSSILRSDCNEES